MFGLYGSKDLDKKHSEESPPMGKKYETHLKFSFTSGTSNGLNQLQEHAKSAIAIM